MKKENKKFEIMIIFIMGIITLIIISFFAIYNIIRERNHYTLILYPFSIFSCYKYDCEDITIQYKKYNNKKYKTFIENEDKGYNKIYYNESNNILYAFNSNNKNIYKKIKDTEEEPYYLLAYEGNVDISQKKYQLIYTNDDELNELANLINKEKLQKYYNYPKVVYDFDNDGKDETLYYLNNIAFENQDSYYAYLFYKDNDKIIILDEVESKKKESVPIIEVKNIFDIYNDGKIEFVVSKNYLEKGHCSILYRLKNNKFVPTNECEITN